MFWWHRFQFVEEHHLWHHGTSLREESSIPEKKGNNPHNCRESNQIELFDRSRSLVSPSFNETDQGWFAPNVVYWPSISSHFRTGEWSSVFLRLPGRVFLLKNILTDSGDDVDVVSSRRGRVVTELVKRIHKGSR